jgi:hypothetical protein
MFRQWSYERYWEYRRRRRGGAEGGGKGRRRIEMRNEKCQSKLLQKLNEPLDASEEAGLGLKERNVQLLALVYVSGEASRVYGGSVAP